MEIELSLDLVVNNKLSKNYVLAIPLFIVLTSSPEKDMIYYGDKITTTARAF